VCVCYVCVMCVMCVCVCYVCVCVCVCVLCVCVYVRMCVMYVPGARTEETREPHACFQSCQSCSAGRWLPVPPSCFRWFSGKVQTRFKDPKVQRRLRCSLLLRRRLCPFGAEPHTGTRCTRSPAVSCIQTRPCNRVDVCEWIEL
jgi:hypothetical protein